MKDMLEKMARMMAKKKGASSEMSDLEKEAKMSVLKHLKKDASDELGRGIKGLKKVTVASPSSEGLKAGLEKAEEIVESPEAMAEPMAEGEEEGSREVEWEGYQKMSSDDLKETIEYIKNILAGREKNEENSESKESEY